MHYAGFVRPSRRGAHWFAAALSLVLVPYGLAYEGDYRAKVRNWRETREAELKAADGWLAVAGLFWLKDGRNDFGTDAGSDVVLPAGSAPSHAGRFDYHDGKVTVRFRPGVSATVDGRPAREAELAADTTGSPTRVKLGRLTLSVIERSGRYGIRLWDPESSTRRGFRGLDWYPVQERYRVRARFVPYDPPKRLPIANVIGQVNRLPSPGRAVFRLGGDELRLDPVLEEPDAKDLFFIFRDATSGVTTYGAGRFLHAAFPVDGTVILDFNEAYSPPCAFTAYATCPLPPPQNRLSLPIEAGEKFAGKH